MGIKKYFFAKTISSNKEDGAQNYIPCEIKEKLHYLSTHTKKEYCSKKTEHFNECVTRLLEIAKTYLYDTYIDDGSDTMVGIVKLTADTILLYDEYIQYTNMDILSIFQMADEVVIEEVDMDNGGKRPALVLKFYLFNIVQT